MTIEQAMAYHPSARPIWTPDDFTAAERDALAVVAEDTATVYDFATGVVIR